MFCELIEGRTFIRGQWTEVRTSYCTQPVILKYGVYHLDRWGQDSRHNRFRIPKTISERYRTLKAFPTSYEIYGGAGYDNICPLCTRDHGQSCNIIICKKCIGQIARDIKRVYFAIWAARKMLGADVGSLMVSWLGSMIFLCPKN